MDMKQCNEIFELSDKDTKLAVRNFVTTTKATGTDIVPTFIKCFPELASSLRDIDASYKQRIGQHRARITYTHIITLACGSLPKCKGCNKQSIKMFPRRPGGCMPDYCSHECLNTSEHAWDKRKRTTRERYGADNYYATKEFKKRIPEILSEKYGIQVVNPSQVPSVQAKKIKTAMRKRGVHHHMQDNKFREIQAKQGNFTSKYYSNMRDTAMWEYESKTGYDNPRKDPKVQAKVAATNIKKYGTANPANSEQVRRKIARSNASENTQQKYQSTSMKNNGTKFPNQSPDVISKAKSKRYTVIHCLGDYIKLEGCEIAVARYLESLGTIKAIAVPSTIGVSVPYVDTYGSSRTYHPDICAVGNTGKKYIIECKVSRTLWSAGFLGITALHKLRALDKYCVERGYTPLLIYVSKQNSIEFCKVTVIKNPVAWMEEAIRRKLKRVLSLNPELVPSL